MKKLFFVFLFLGFHVIAFPYSKDPLLMVDAHVKTVRYSGDIKTLAVKLTSIFKTDLEKTRAIFRWLADNISYDVKEYHAEHSAYNGIWQSIPAETKNIHSVYEVKLAQYVLKNKAGICSGYATAFKVLADSAGLRSAIVTGIAKNNVSQVGIAQKSNHAWNAVFLNEKWQLLDVTWSAGSCDSAVKVFTKGFSESYFLPSPKKMILNHFPDEQKWALTTVPAQTAFYGYPLVYDGYFVSEISSFAPLNGAIEAKPGKKITIEFRLPSESADVRVVSNTGSNAILKKKEERIVSYEYTITSDKDDELIVFFNDKPVLGYRLFVIP